jgi:hypothetical protein
MWCVFAEYIHQGALPGPLKPEDEEVIWQAVRDGHDAYCSGKLSKLHVVLSDRAWKGSASWWNLIQQALPTRLRASGAYLLGHRYLHLDGKKPKDAVPLFQQAVKEAPPDSPVRRLAQAQLDRLQAK